MTFNIRLAGIAAMTAAAIITAPAFAGTCPAGQSAANALAGAPTTPVGVTDTVIGSVDLDKELSFAGHDLRLRRLVVQPGGIVPLHSHAGRPALITVVTGQATEHRSTCAVGIVHHAGDVAHESDGISHWWKNEGRTPTILLSADVKGRE